MVRFIHVICSVAEGIFAPGRPKLCSAMAARVELSFFCSGDWATCDDSRRIQTRREEKSILLACRCRLSNGTAAVLDRNLHGERHMDGLMEVHLLGLVLGG